MGILEYLILVVVTLVMIQFGIMYSTHKDKLALRELFAVGQTIRHIKTKGIWEVFKLENDIAYIRLIGDSLSKEKAIVLVTSEGVVNNHLHLQWEKL